MPAGAGASAAPTSDTIPIQPSAKDAIANARFIIVERQQTPLPQTEGSGVDMAVANPHNTKVIFDRDMAKVFELTLQPKDAASMHYCPDRLIYSPEPSQFIILGADGSKTKQSAGVQGMIPRTGAKKVSRSV